MMPKPRRPAPSWRGPQWSISGLCPNVALKVICGRIGLGKVAQVGVCLPLLDKTFGRHGGLGGVRLEGMSGPRYLQSILFQ